jgi:hypothetical protein
MDWKLSQIVFPQSLGCEAYVKRLMSDKLTPKSDKCFFVGYLRENKGYYFYNKAEGKMFVARNGVFMEKEFLSKRVSGSKVQLEEIQKTPKNVSASTDVEAPAPRKCIGAHHVTKNFTLLTTEQPDILLLDNDETITYTEAMMGPDSKKWLGAMESKIQFMHDNQVWNLVDPIDCVRAISCKWVFKKRRTRMEMLTSIRHEWWRKALSRFMVLTMIKLSHPS